MTGPGARLLLVDDDPVHRVRVRYVLEDAAYHVEEAETGEEALEMLARGGFDAVLLDIDLPGIRGFDVLREMSDMPSACGLQCS